MTYGHAEVARRAAGLHDKEKECVRCAYAVVGERLQGAPTAVQLGSVVGKAVELAVELGATREEIVKALSVEFDIYERSC